MLDLLLPADRQPIAQLYRTLRALLWLILLLALVVEWLTLPHRGAQWGTLALMAVVGVWLWRGQHWQRHWPAQLWVDLGLLLLWFYAHGGGANPLLALLLLPLGAAAATLGFWHWLMLVAVAGGGYALMVLQLPAMPGPEHAHMASGSAIDHLWQMWASFLLAAALTGTFINRLAAHVRIQGQRLLQLHQRQGRHAMITASGARAAAACHHLATPLNNLLLLQEHWQSDPEVPAHWRDDLAEMQQQLLRCQQALAPLRIAGGVAAQTSLMARLQALVEEWRLMQPLVDCSLEADGAALANVWWPEDGLLHHALWNLMDNGARAGGPLRLSVVRTGARLQLSVMDHGPGFPAWLLAEGTSPAPPMHGMGLGVALVRTAMDLCGGRLILRNDGGGCATLDLPLAYLQRTDDHAPAAD